MMAEELGRECGECNVCCIMSEITDPDLVKPAGVPCPHLCASGCSIHEAKPSDCRAFLCAWRVMGQLPDTFRPDRSGLFGIVGRADGPSGRIVGVQFIPVKSADPLRSSAVLKALRSLVADGLQIFVGLPRKGEWPPQRRLNLNTLPNRQGWRKLAAVASGLLAAA